MSIIIISTSLIIIHYYVCLEFIFIIIYLAVFFTWIFYMIFVMKGCVLHLSSKCKSKQFAKYFSRKIVKCANVKTFGFFVIFEAVSRMKSRKSLQKILELYMLSLLCTIQSEPIIITWTKQLRVICCYYSSGLSRKKSEKELWGTKAKLEKKTDIRKGKMGERGEWSYD